MEEAVDMIAWLITPKAQMTNLRRFFRIWPIALGASILFLGQQFGRNGYVFSHLLTPRVVDVIASVSKLACQAYGAYYAARCARSLEKDNPVRLAWALVAGWLASCFVGQAILGAYVNVLGYAEAPLPSAADAFFVIGYGCILVALVRFVSSYRESAFAPSRLRDDLLSAFGACALFALVGWRILVPIALGPTPLIDRIINVGYPVLDLVLLIPTLMLLRLTVRFAGGKLWVVWASLLTGILCSAGADILFSDVSPENEAAVGSIVDLLTVWSYLYCAHGARLQYELVTE